MASRIARGERPDPAARLRALTRRAYTAGSGHLDLDAGEEFDRIVRGDPPPREPGQMAPGSRTSGAPAGPTWSGGRHLREDAGSVGSFDSGQPAPGGQTDPRGAAQPPAGPGARRELRSPRRWAVSVRAAAAVLAVVAALTGVVVIRSLGPGEPVAVPERTQDSVTSDATQTDAPSEPAQRAPSAEPGADASADPTGAGPASTDLAAGSGAPSSSGAGPPGGSPVVHVAGAVAAPGIVELPAGARVAQAIEAAGGATGDAELAAVNLARPVTDGEQVYVPRVGEAAPGTAAGLVTGGTAGADGAPAGEGDAEVVDLNTADQARLETLPGVGPAIAQRILDWRAEHGGFHSVDELLEVSGIGPATLERLRERVRV